MNNPLDTIFQTLLKNKSIFKNKEVLRASYTPNSLLHRDEQINNIATVLVSALRGNTPSNILIYGKTGTGKTACTCHIGIKLEKISEEMDKSCTVIYINCEIIDTQYRLLANIARQFGEDIPMTGWPTDHVFEKFKESIDKKPCVVIIILDEIDKLIKKGDDVLYNLSRINSDLKNSKLSMIGISNDLKFTEFLDPRIKSSLGEEEIVFPPYDAKQLSDILMQRAALSYNEGVLDEVVIPLCAAFAAQEHGDARRALDLLRVAGELTEREKSDKVLEKHVRKAQKKIEFDHINEVLKTLPTQTKLVLYSILLLNKSGNNTITTGEMFNTYVQLCEIVDIDDLTQRRVADLMSELDMLGIVNAKVVSKGRYGRTKEISLSVSAKNTQKVLLEDYRLKPLENYTHVVNNQMRL